METTMRYHYILTRKTKMKKTEHAKCWVAYRATGTLILCWWEYGMVRSLWEKIWQFLKKLNVHLPYNPLIPLLGVYPSEMKAYVPAKTGT